MSYMNFHMCEKLYMKYRICKVEDKNNKLAWLAI